MQQGSTRTTLAFEFWLALRLAWSERRQAVAATLAVAVAVLLVVAVQALGAGWQSALTNRLLALVPSLTVEAEPGSCLDNPGLLREQSLQVPGVVAVAPYSSGAALLLRGDVSVPVSFRAVDWSAEAQVTRFAHYIHPKVDPYTFDAQRLVLGAGVASQAGVETGDKVELLSPAGKETFSVAGVFNTGHTDLDDGLVIISLAAASQLGAGCIQGLGIAANVPPSHAGLGRIRLDIQRSTGAWVRPWYEGQRALLSGLAVERRITLVVGLFSVLTAAIGVGAVLSVRVFQHQPTIGILTAVGATPGSVGRTFLLEGLVLGIVGAGSGIVTAVPLLLGIAHWPIRLPVGYGLEYIPVTLAASHVVTAGLLGIVLCGLAAILPARRAARLSPVAALAGR